MADDDVDSIDDGQLYDFGAEAASFPSSGQKKPVNYGDVPTMVLPGACTP